MEWVSQTLRVPPSAVRGLGLRALLELLEAKPPFPRPISRIVLSPCQRTLPPRVACPLLRIKVPSKDGPPASLLRRDLLDPSSVWPAGVLPGAARGRGGLLTPFLVHDSRCHTRGRVPGPALLTTNGARWGWEERPASLSPWSYSSESPVCEGWEPFRRAAVRTWSPSLPKRSTGGPCRFHSRQRQEGPKAADERGTWCLAGGQR